MEIISCKSYFQVSGYYYHLCSNIWKNVQHFGLQIRCMADEELALTIPMLAVLAFVPANNVIDSFDTLAYYRRNGYGQDLSNMLNYFKNIYIGWFRHNAPRRSPTFKIQTLNMFHRTDNDLPRTNNAIEGWYRGFQ